jgi:hypothetical protein
MVNAGDSESRHSLDHSPGARHASVVARVHSTV